MSILSLFKKRKKKPPFVKATKGKEKKKVEKKEEGTPLGEIKLPQAVKKVKKKDFSEAYRILKEAHITEKATKLGGENKYIFKVFPKANKIEIKRAVQDLYGVAVGDVNIINIHRKAKGLAGRKRGGHKGGYKKAIVTLSEGEKMELMPR